MATLSFTWKNDETHITKLWSLTDKARLGFKGKRFSDFALPVFEMVEGLDRRQAAGGRDRFMKIVKQCEQFITRLLFRAR
jgi:hypothetical protein